MILTALAYCLPEVAFIFIREGSKLQHETKPKNVFTQNTLAYLERENRIGFRRQYSHHFIFFVTYEWAQKARVLYLASFSGLVHCNTLAYQGHSRVTKKMKCCEYRPNFFLSNLSHLHHGGSCCRWCKTISHRHGLRQSVFSSKRFLAGRAYSMTLCPSGVLMEPQQIFKELQWGLVGPSGPQWTPVEPQQSQQRQ